MNEDDRFLFLDLKLMERLEENQENQEKENNFFA